MPCSGATGGQDHWKLKERIKLTHSEKLTPPIKCSNCFPYSSSLGLPIQALGSEFKLSGGNGRLVWSINVRMSRHRECSMMRVLEPRIFEFVYYLNSGSQLKLMEVQFIINLGQEFAPAGPGWLAGKP